MATFAQKPLMSLDDALAHLLAHARPLADTKTATEYVSTMNADGRVLAHGLVSALHVPPHDNSSMDGYAVRCAELGAASVVQPVVLPVSQRIAAGQSGHALQPGTVARVFTGAPIPTGADAVVMQEQVTETGEGAQTMATFTACAQAGAWIRRAGEDVSRGTEALRSGTRLGPAELGLAAGLGLAELSVCRRPRVALFSTGNELVMPGTVPPEAMVPGAIYNSNCYFLQSMLKRLGCDVSDFGTVPDNREATLNALAQAALQHDLILTSGGVSVGEEDHVKPAVQQLGTLDLWQINMKPGKPFAFGSVHCDKGSAHFMGLPGNPVSSFITFLMLVRPFLLRFQGVVDVSSPVQHLSAHFSLPKPDKRREFLRVRRNAQAGLDLFPNQSSGVLTSAVWGDGVVDNPCGQPIVHGDMVRYFAFADLLN